MLTSDRKKSVLWVCIWAGLSVLVAWQLWGILFTTSSPMSAYGIFGDEAVVTQAAVRIADGQIPHRDFYSFTAGSAYYPLAGWMKVFGLDYTSVRWYNLVTTLMLTAAIVLLGSRFSRWVGTAVGLIFVFGFFPIWPMVSYHWQFLLFAVLGTCCLAMRLTTPRLILAGLALVGAGLTLPNKAIFLCLAQLLFILLSAQKGNRYRSVAIFLLAPILVGGVAIFVLDRSYTLSTVWTQIVTNNVTFYPTIVHKSIFGLNSNGYGMLLLTGVLCLPLLRKSWLRSDWRRAYALLAVSQVALVVSILYQSTWEHFVQISAISIVLLMVASTDRMQQALRSFRLGSLKKFLQMLLMLCFFLVVGAWLFVKIFHLTPQKYRVPFKTPRGEIFVESLFPVPGTITSQLQDVDRLLRTTLVGKRIFFYPYMPGFYYFYQIENPTSYDILPSSQPPKEVEQRLKDELLTNVDVLVFIRSSWPDFDPASELMVWMRQQFPHSSNFENTRIQIFSKEVLSLEE